MNPRALLCRALPLLAVLPALAFAQPRDEHRGPRVVLFEHPNFQGGAIVLYPGQSLDNLAHQNFDNGRRSNDRITSILVEGGADVMVYSDAHFRGEALRVTNDIRDLSRGDNRFVRFNDRISSIRVEARRGPGRPPGNGHEGPHGGDRPPSLEPEKIIRRAFQDILEREPTTADMRHYRSLIIDRGFDEKRVRDEIRRGDEYRITYMTRRLNRVYQEILGRDVDPRGFEHYRNKIIEHNWNDDDIRRDLRNSTEYRNRPRTHAEPPRRAEDAAPSETQK
jgi:hypothetical protein